MPAPNRYSAYCSGGYLDSGGVWVFIDGLSGPWSEKAWETLLQILD